MVFDEILQLLDEAGVPYRLHEHAVLRTVQDVEEQLPFLADKMLKTIAFRRRDGSRVLAGLRGHDRIDYRKLAAVFDVNRRDIASLSPQQVEAQLGFEVGGVGPFALREDVALVFDERLAAMETVCCGSGKNTVTLEIDFADLRRVAGGRLADITKI